MTIRARNLRYKLQEQIDPASLAFFRIVFGLILLFGQLRFLSKGWVEQLYLRPTFFFKYYGFEWIERLPGQWMYLPWIVMAISLLFVIVGKYYRIAIIVFFLCFSYTELLDTTNYLNHHYLIGLLSFLMIFLPMNASFSIDAKSRLTPTTIPRWTLTVLRLQVGLVYFFAGVSKIKYDWLIHAEPLKMWLGACQNIPVAGKWLAMPMTAYVLGWAGTLFDLTAPFLLINKRARPYEYLLIVVFHLATFWLFYIGVFPLLMIGLALIFFSPAFHRKILRRVLFFTDDQQVPTVPASPVRGNNKFALVLFGVYFLWQFLMPLRQMLYKGNVLWTEQGFRYSWNVMLMEKNGVVEFNVKDKVSHQSFIEYPQKYLTPLQEKMMTTQPDLILQYAHFLGKKYQNALHHPVAVYASAYASLNLRPGKTFIDPTVDLSSEHDGFRGKQWILPEN